VKIFLGKPNVREFVANRCMGKPVFREKENDPGQKRGKE